ncbi:hypothetical protein DTO027B9_744 [Paecilomyces variotii]|nr:hypothetical protein DTO027B9_744 [Paecilomyces variotii]KAJ9409900.1 hypothetical protein DTO045G8_2376 [Paecilomyces variotii]
MASFSTGVFTDTVGLSYKCGDLSGTTSSPNGQFQYYDGDDISFSIGSLQLGVAKGRQRLSVLDLVDNPSLSNPKLLNRAALLFSLTPSLGFEKAIQINDDIQHTVSNYAHEINLDAEDTRDVYQVLQKIGAEIGIPVKSIPHVRNHLRRAIAGFRVFRDIQIPVRDGNYVLGDIYLPPEGKLPALVSSTVYGKRVVYSGPRRDDYDEVAAFEKAEDDWHSTSADVPLHIPNTGPWFGTWTKQRVYETIGTFNTFYWVPRGYAMVKIDPRGVSQTPGTRGVLVSPQESSDISDVVEWVARQPWCTGNVGLAGNSYGANCQWPSAVRKPQGLRAIIPYATDVDLYRDLGYVGGISAWNYLRPWSDGINAASPRWPAAEDLVTTFSSHPFYDDYWERLQCEIEDIDIPVFMAAAQMLIFHHRGPYEAWRRVSSTNKHLQIVDSNYFSWPNEVAAHKLLRFTERYLKGLDNYDLEKVGIQMRIGDGKWYWRTEDDWEIPGTKYIDWHLYPDGSLRPETPVGAPVKTLSYMADIEPKSAKAGVSFLSKPFGEDIELIGHFTATLNISSTSHDADVVVSLWAIDENDQVVKFCTGPNLEPLASGLLRASHRATDPEKSLPWRPWHTHLEKDYAPLQREEVCEVNVEICPVAARIRSGWRLRVDILPSEAQPDIPSYRPPPLRSWAKEYHVNAINTLHVGGGYSNFVRVPVVPLKEIGPLNEVP